MVSNLDHLQPSFIVVSKLKVPFANHSYIWIYTILYSVDMDVFFGVFDGRHKKVWEEKVKMWDKFPK
jgi:hypothetical protein